MGALAARAARATGAELGGATWLWAAAGAVRSAAPNSAPLPPNAIRSKSRGSLPRSVEMARIARVMFDTAMR